MQETMMALIRTKNGWLDGLFTGHFTSNEMRCDSVQWIRKDDR